MARIVIFCLLLGVTTGLTACGKRGPLSLPQQNISHDGVNKY